ncbi:hypothetical protein Ae201684P_008568 [Aphanomyces euteiches]|nr:hypothetical protein Ae201684P_008568 [Aphanomyces euteiches]
MKYKGKQPLVFSMFEYLCGKSLLLPDGGFTHLFLILYEAAGDQYTGRVAAGLPVNSSDFSIVPPHFPDPDDPILVGALKMSIPTLHNISHLGGVLRLILASLVYHFDYLTTMLPASHPLLSTPLFVNDSVRVYLQSVLKSGLDSKFLMDRSILSLPRQIVDKISALLEETDQDN